MKTTAVLVFFLAAIVRGQQTGTLPAGARCITTTLNGANARCISGLDCVIVHHGIPNTNIENTGTCVKLNRSKLKRCSVDYCSKSGHTATCVDTYNPFVATKCGAYATRVDGGRKPNCSFTCPPLKCNSNSPNMFRSSGGKWYCGMCSLKLASCKSGFMEFGPLIHGSSPNGGACSVTSRNMKPCFEKSACLINDFGNGQADAGGTHSKGVCIPKGPFVTCSVDFCSQYGAYAYCRTPIEAVVTKCGIWAGRTDFGLKPDCRLTCIRGYCELPPTMDSKGKKYCSRCHLRKASCEGQFKVFGKMPPPIAKDGWLCSTNNPNSGKINCENGYVCLIKHFGYPPAGFQNTGNCTPGNKSLPNCTAKACRNVRDRRCITVDTKDVTTCEYWRIRSDAGL